jgi:hypothetical protein
MSVTYNPRIVTDGLVLAVDAGNTKSYNVGVSSTTLFDMSTRGNNVIGIGTSMPSYSEENGGVLIFDGIDDYLTNNSLDFSSANNLFAESGKQWSVSAWFKFPVSPTRVRDNNVNSGNCSYAIVSRGGGIGPLCSFNLFVHGTSTNPDANLSGYENYCVVNIRGVNTPISPSSVNTGTWNNVVVVWDGTNCNSYFNSVGVTTVNVGTSSIQNLQLRIANASDELQDVGLHNFEGNIGNVSIYNKSLTSQEIQQNYNASRSRFGI